MKIKNILVPIDFSPCSKNALKYAIHLAKMFDSKIHMVNAVHIHSSHPDVLGGNIVDAVIADYESQIQKSFEALETEIIELQEVPHSADRFLSYLIDAIHTECHNNNIDMIVMGTRDDHDELEKILGSRTTDVIDSAHVPVLIVPESWEKTEIHKIAFAFNIEEIKNPNRIKMLNSFAVDTKSEVMAFSIMKDRDAITLEDQKIYGDLVQRFDEGIASFRTVEADSVLDGITSFCNAQQPDILAIIPKEHGFFERLFKKSISKTIALNVHIPSLFFRE